MQKGLHPFFFEKEISLKPLYSNSLTFKHDVKKQRQKNRKYTRIYFDINLA
tara:strand:- start:452 stop:604 length:153 start_codon:yes stop_codon:yes gene_type:complete